MACLVAIPTRPARVRYLVPSAALQSSLLLAYPYYDGKETHRNHRSLSCPGASILLLPSHVGYQRFDPFLVRVIQLPQQASLAGQATRSFAAHTLDS